MWRLCLPLVIRPTPWCYEVPYTAWQVALLNLFAPGLVETREAVGTRGKPALNGQWQEELLNIRPCLWARCILVDLCSRWVCK